MHSTDASSNKNKGVYIYRAEYYGGGGCNGRWKTNKRKNTFFLKIFLLRVYREKRNVNFPDSIRILSGSLIEVKI